MLTIVLILGAVAAVPSTIFALVEGQPVIALVDVLAVAAVVALRFVPTISHRARTLYLLVLVYALGVWFLFRVGWVSHVYLIAVPVLAALLLGLRPAIIALAVNAATLLVAGIGFGVGPFLDDAGTHISPGTAAPRIGWVIVTLNFMFVDAALAISCAVLFAWFERSYVEQQHVSESFVEQRMHLHRTNDALVHEIAERKRIEADLSRVTSAVDQAREVILIAAPNGRIVYRNAAGHELARRLGGVDQLQHLDDLGTELPTEPTSDWVGSVVVPTGVGVGFQYELTMASVHSGTGRRQASIAVLRDVTIERQLEDRAQRAERLEALGTLASGVAHDFNNVIASVLGTAEWMRGRSATDAELDEAWTTIITACERAAGIVREMMVLGRRSQLVRVDLSMRDVLQGAMPVLRGLLPPTIELHETFHGDAVIVATQTEIDRILTNLVANARDSIGTTAGVISVVLDTVEGDDGPRAGPRIGDGGGQGDESRSMALRHGGRCARLTVSDTGRGIEAADLPRIFDPFFTTRQTEGGTGLGLAGVNAIVTGLGGEIDVFSEIGFGAAFVVHFPLADTDGVPRHPRPEAGRQEDPRSATAHLAVAAAGHESTILVVDDNEALLTVVTRGLERAGFTVIPAPGPAEAIAAFDRDPAAIDLLLSDLTMPRMSGNELVIELRRRRADLPAVLMTGLGETDVEADPTRADVTALLHKPFAVSELIDVVRRALPVREPASSNGEA